MAAAPSAGRILEALHGAEHVALAWEGDRLVGFATALTDGALFASVPLVEVVADRRGEGIGSGLIRSLLDRLSDKIEDLEDRILAGGQDGDTLRLILGLKRELLELRRSLSPQRDVANALLRRDLPLVDDASAPYFQDLYDHLVRVLDQLDLQRDLLASALEANLSVTSNNLNEVVKRLTAFTVILMVPTLIAGVYGMNFRFMPELSSPLGYPFALGVMAVAMIGAAVFFKRNGWF